MKAVIRALHSPDVDDLEGWTPPVADDFGFLLQLLVGPSDGPGEESFDVVVCTPKWFAKWIADKPITLGRHYLFVHAYEFERLHDFVRGYVEGSTLRPGTTWPNASGVLVGGSSRTISRSVRSDRHVLARHADDAARGRRGDGRGPSAPTRSICEDEADDLSRDDDEDPEGGGASVDTPEDEYARVAIESRTLRALVHTVRYRRWHQDWHQMISAGSQT